MYAIVDIAGQQFKVEKDQKVYVQDRMRQQGKVLWQWLEAGGYFFVCGDASRMAADVENALHEVIALHGQFSANAAASYIQHLTDTGRYSRDVY